MSITQPVCICSLRYPACNALAPYCQQWPAPLYTIFSTLYHKRHDFLQKKIKLVNTINVLIFSTNISETFLILGRTEKDMIKKCILVFM
jgi:hypothetical protein